VKERDILEDLDVDGRIIENWILKKRGVRVWTEFIWLGEGTWWQFLVITVMYHRVSS
jgi:hypothetical protein